MLQRNEINEMRVTHAHNTEFPQEDAGSERFTRMGERKKEGRDAQWREIKCKSCKIKMGKIVKEKSKHAIRKKMKGVQSRVKLIYTRKKCRK